MTATEGRTSRVVEILALLTIVATGTALGVPKFATMQRQAAAEAMLADVEQLRVAVYAFYSDSAYFPADQRDGAIPEPLLQYLPVRYTPQRAYGTLAYRNWPAPPAPVPAPAISDSAMSDSLPADSVAADSVAADSIAANEPELALRSLSPTDSADPRGAAPEPAQAPRVEVEVAPEEERAPNVVGIVVTPADLQVGEMALRLARGMARFRVANRFTFLLFGA